MGRDHLGPSRGQDAAEQPRGHGHSPSRASILGRLAQPARIALVAALGLGLGILTIDGNQHAPLSTLVAPAAAAPAVAPPTATSDVRLAYAEIVTLAPPPTTPTPVSDMLPAASPAEATIAVAEVVEPVTDELVTDEPVADQDELLRELRPQLSARGGLRASEAQLEAQLSAAQAVQAPSKEGMISSVAVQPTPKPPTKTPTPKPTPRPAATKAPTPRPVATTVTASSSTLGQKVVSIALRYVGYRYTSGGTSPSTGFDCSGFTYFVYKTAGHPISRDIFVQYRTGIAVSRSSLMPGDLVFFQNTYRYGLSHASIYIGGGRIVHAQSESTGVTTSSLSTTYWSSHYLGARRP